MAYGSLLTDTVQSSTTGTPPQFNDGSGTQVGTLCRAWVNYKGTATRGINASFNVSSVTFNSTGDYTLNFTTALNDANYSTLVTSGDSGTGMVVGTTTSVYTTTTCRIVSLNSGQTGYVDLAKINVAIFR